MGVITQAIRNRINQDLSQGLGKTDVNIERLEYYLRGIEALVEGGGGGGGVNSVLGSWVDNTDPVNPIVNVPFSNWIATANPTVSDDDTVGYIVGSTWINNITGQLFVATDVTTGAAVWAPGTTLLFVDIDFDDVVAPPVALIEGVTYRVNNFPAFLFGNQIDCGFFQAIKKSPSSAVLSKYGTAFLLGAQLETKIAVDWYDSSPSRILHVHNAFNNVTVSETFGSAANLIASGLWTVGLFKNSSIDDFKLINLDPTTQTLSITDSVIGAGSSIDAAGFTGTIIASSNIGPLNAIVASEDDSILNEAVIGADNTIIMPTNGGGAYSGMAYMTIGSHGSWDFSVSNGTIESCILPSNQSFAATKRPYVDIDFTKGYFLTYGNITQLGTGVDPTIDVFKNETGGTLTTGYDAAGQYRLTCSIASFGATASDAWLHVGNPPFALSADTSIAWVTDSRVDFSCGQFASGQDDILLDTPFEIRTKIF